MAYDPTHPRFLATYLSNAADPHWLNSVLTGVEVPNGLLLLRADDYCYLYLIFLSRKHGVSFSRRAICHHHRQRTLS